MKNPEPKPKRLLRDVGASLPVGFSTGDGALIKNIEDRPWRLKEERELGRYRNQHRDINVAAFVSVVLATLCKRLGPHDFGAIGDKLEEKRIIVGQMWLPDVYFTYVWLRLRALGPDFNMQITCPNCIKKFAYEADLDTTLVRCAESLDETKWKYTLRDALEIRGKKVEEITFGPARWNALENVQGGSLDTGEAKAALICGSVHELTGFDEPVALAPHEFDDMSKFDLERIAAQLTEHAYGPEMAVKDNCPQCGSPFEIAMDWGYDVFFATSSR